ncbi:MAG TPA: hemerythrin family protein [Azospira sp.]|nr:hemerythrin family protein [Azospira sp.]
MFPPISDPSLIVGIPAIDHEHARLFAEIQRLIGPPAVRLDSAAFSEIVSRLWQQLAEHFANEEMIMARCGLPADELAEHRRVHWEILEQYTELQFELMSPAQLDQTEVLSRIRSWVVGHLLEYDMKLQPYAVHAE